MATITNTAERMPTAAIIGMGLLGSRIAAELLLLGAEVTVYDRTLCEQASTLEAAARAAREKVAYRTLLASKSVVILAF